MNNTERSWDVKARWGAPKTVMPPNAGPNFPGGMSPNTGPTFPGGMSPNAGPPKPGLWDRAKAAGTQARAGVNNFFSAAEPSAPGGLRETLKKGWGATKAGLGAATRNLNSLSGAISAGDDLGALIAADNVGLPAKIGGGLEIAGNVAGNALIDAGTRGVGLIAPTLATAANQYLGGARPVTALARNASRLFGGDGKSGLDVIREQGGLPAAKDSFSTIARFTNGVSSEVQPKTPIAPVTQAAAGQQQPEVLSENPFARASTLEAEALRQMRNGTSVQYGGNGKLADAQAQFDSVRDPYGANGKGGKAAFEDPKVQLAFNAKNMLEGTGISVGRNKNGVVEFSGNNTLGGGKLYRAADGSLTTDWSKTKNYADAIERNQADQDQLAKLTRGAALSGDKEAVARLTRGDGRLEAIAKEAGTERDLREAVSNGSRFAAAQLADMERNRADQAYKAADLGLRAAQIQGQSEDRALTRALSIASQRETMRQHDLQEKRDARDYEEKWDKDMRDALEKMSTVDGKLDNNLLRMNTTAAAHLQKDPKQNKTQYLAEVGEESDLNKAIRERQWLIDSVLSPEPGKAPVMFKVNPNRLRGGYVSTDGGMHLSQHQIDTLPPELKTRLMNKHLIKDGM